jgi:hypothetical protein
MSDNSSTTVTETDLDINDILGMPGAESVMTPAGNKEEKPNLFTSKPVDMSFIENDDEEDTASTGTSKAPIASSNESQTFTNSEGTDELQNLLDETDKTGRPKVSKDAMIELTKKLIEQKKLIPFDDEKPIEKYTVQDFEELLEANMQENDRKVREEVPREFFDNLPTELKIAAKYYADGGNDLKGLFRSLAQVEEIKQLDPRDPNDQEDIVRAYLHATQFGNSEEIEEEIISWKDHDQLDAKALKFKPKLDAMQQQYVARQLQQQEVLRNQQHEQSKLYMNSVYSVLDPGELNGMKLDKKTQSALYAGLIQTNYPSISGKPTNQLGHLLEKYQWVEPRHDLIAEALWLLSDPEGYRAKVKEGGAKAAIEKTARMLKTEEKNKIGSSQSYDDNDEFTTKPSQKLSRPSQGFFKR